jgi:hypothetical protein
MRRLTLTEVKDHHGGVLPPDAVLRPDHEEPPTPTTTKTVARTPKPKPTRRGERFAVLNTFTDFSLAGLTGAEAKVWLILFRDTKATGTARTGQADIARRAGIDPRTVRRVLVKLEAKGLVQVVRRGRLNAGPSVYRVKAIGTA